jgi:hypothetical protein
MQGGRGSNMITSIGGYFAIFLFIGIGVGTMAVIFFRFIDRRRPVFRFGGDDPFSWGEKKKWALWLVFGYCFAFITTFKLFTSSGTILYGEIALSIIEGPLITVGLFLIDRIAMLFVEPEADWHPEMRRQALRQRTGGAPITPLPDQPDDQRIFSPEQEDRLAASVRVLKQASEKVSENAESDPAGEETYFHHRSQQAGEIAKEACQEIVEHTTEAVKSGGGLFTGMVRKIRQSRVKREQARTEARQQRTKEYDDILKNH